MIGGSNAVAGITSKFKVASITGGALAFLQIEFADWTIKLIQIAIGVMAFLYGWNRWQESRARRRAAESAERVQERAESAGGGAIKGV